MAGGQTIMTMPRIAVIRSFVMNHTVHHRAQLGVYLRLNDIPVPALYGPTGRRELSQTFLQHISEATLQMPEEKSAGDE